jgi:hypothetical protein
MEAVIAYVAVANIINLSGLHKFCFLDKNNTRGLIEDRKHGLQISANKSHSREIGGGNIFPKSSSLARHSGSHGIAILKAFAIRLFLARIRIVTKSST